MSRVSAASDPSYHDTFKDFQVEIKDDFENLGPGMFAEHLEKLRKIQDSLTIGSFFR